MRKKILLIALVITLVVALLVNTVSASSFVASITPNKTTVAESAEFTVTIKVTNIDAGTNGINTMSGVFSYDTKVFESIVSSSISGLSGWSPSYFPDTGKIVLLKTAYTKNDEDVLQITLKTKANTAGKTGAVSFKSITAGNSETEMSASDISTTITVGNVPAGEEGNTSTNTNSGGPQSINTNTNPIRNNTVNTNTNTNKAIGPAVNNTSNINVEQESDIPYTGTSDNIMRAIFVVLVIAGISYFKYESIKDN